MNPKMSAVIDIIAKRKKARELAARKKRKAATPPKQTKATSQPAGIKPAEVPEAPVVAEEPVEVETPVEVEAPVEIPTPEVAAPTAPKKKYKSKKKTAEMTEGDVAR